MINITLKDGSIREYEKGTTVLEMAQGISRGLARVAMAGEVDGQLADLRQPVYDDSTLNINTFDDKNGKEAFWHTSSHILAQAVRRLFPEAKLAIGPAIDNGFYYDFDVDEPFSTEDLEKIENEMARIVKENYRLERFELSREEAIKLMEQQGESYKVELIEDLPEDSVISFYKQDDFTDLCAGPHIISTGGVKAIKLLSVAGAYWRGSEKNKMLQRIYGVSYPKKSQLDQYLERLEEAKKRDHRKLGKDLDLFSMLEEGPGFPFFHSKGMVLRNELEGFWRKEHTKAGYQEIKSPILLNRDLWIRSGHWDHYKENMYLSKIDDSDYAIKPMNCPGSMLIYKRKIYSYRDLPLRMGELGLVHRHELSGALHGLMRVRSFTQDDAHIFMLPEQIKDEVVGVIELVDHFYKVFGFKYHVELSTKPDEAMGSDEDWDRAINALKEALVHKDIDYVINEGDGAFYGPKIDFHLEDSIGRTWQCGTIQLDFQMPDRFDLTYIGSDGERHRPVMVHRVVFGSIERFIAILIEHYAGAFPAWLAPVQVKLLSITDRSNEFINEITDLFNESSIRTESDLRNEKIGFKIREAQMEKVPYMLIIGDKEVESGSVSVRSRSEGSLGPMKLEEFKEHLLKEINERTI
ncbi:MAG TPA: threonine--tRNA ligase [Bacillota bacterium]|nr:threonine--tRNA ligase [Bacillota bacterium]